MLNRRRILVGAGGLVAAASAGAQSAPRARVIRYAQRAGAEANLTSLDFYAAAGGGGGAPLVVFIHGGGWRIGDKSNPGAGADKAAFFTARGFAYASLNYRLSPDVTHPAHVEDVAAGLSYLIDNAGALGADVGRVFVMGHSAGAHLAALAATDARRLGAHGKTLGALRGIVLLDGAGYDVAAQMRALNRADTMLGDMYRAAFGEDPALWADASPVRFVGPGLGIAPFLIVHTDRRAALRQSHQLASALRAAGIEARLYRASGLTHADVNRGIGGRSDLIGPQILAALRAWGG